MSYSFTIRAASKAKAKEKVKEQLDSVVQQQPCHAFDMPLALTAAEAFIDVLPDGVDQDVQVSVHGSVSGTWQPDNSIIDLRSAGVGVTAYYVAREV